MITDINVGLVPNDGLGDKLRMAFIIANNNFDYINGILTGNNTLTISQITGLQTALNNISAQLVYIPEIQDDVNSINSSIYNINSQITSNNSSIADLYQKDSNSVHKTGNETINGNKTFNAGNLFVKTSNGSSIGKINFLENEIIFYKNQTNALAHFLNGSLLLYKNNNIYANISVAGLTSSRTYTLPNESGTFALDENVVHLDGNETIAGLKTFTNNTFRFGSAIISAAGLTMSRTYTLPNQAGSIALDANVVHMTGNETITGIKTFISDLIVNGIDVGRGNSNTSVLVGNDALKSNTGGNSNVAIGYQAIFSATNSSYLVAVGPGALKMNTSGSANTAIGAEALTANTIGNNNTAVGREALTSNTQGFGNTSVGRSSLFTNLGGINNSAFGGYALFSNISGAGNVAIGLSASSNTTGSNNIAIGLGALQNNITGNGNIAIGATASALGTNNTNSIVIGTGAVGLGSNTTVIGTENTSITGLYGNIRLLTGMAVAPATITSTGILGEIRVTSGFIYVCIATNSWRRTALTTW